MMAARAGLLAGTAVVVGLLAPAHLQAHLPSETSAELRLREGTLEVSLAVSARRLVEPPASGSGVAAGSGAVAAGLQLAGAFAAVDSVALQCGGASVPLALVGKLDGDALIAAAGGAERHLVVQLRGDRPADALLQKGCRLFLPAAFGPYFASMSAPQPVFAASGGWSELKVTGVASAPPLPASPASPTPLAIGLLVLGLSLLAARAGFVWGRRKP